MILVNIPGTIFLISFPFSLSVVREINSDSAFCSTVEIRLCERSKKETVVKLRK